VWSIHVYNTTRHHFRSLRILLAAEHVVAARKMLDLQHATLAVGRRTKSSRAIARPAFALQLHRSCCRLHWCVPARNTLSSIPNYLIETSCLIANSVLFIQCSIRHFPPFGSRLKQLSAPIFHWPWGKTNSRSVFFRKFLPRSEKLVKIVCITYSKIRQKDS